MNFHLQQVRVPELQMAVSTTEASNITATDIAHYSVGVPIKGPSVCPLKGSLKGSIGVRGCKPFLQPATPTLGAPRGPGLGFRVTRFKALSVVPPRRKVPVAQ